MRSSAPKKFVKPYGLDEQLPASNKWTAITGLLLVTSLMLGLVLRLIFPGKKPEVHLASVVVADYPERLLPKPAFVDWQIEWEKIRRFKPWSSAAETGKNTIETADELSRAPSAVLKKLSGNTDIKNDTLIVYLRGLSLVVPKSGNAPQSNVGGETSELVMLAPEYRPSDEPNAYFPIVQLLRELKQVPIKHVIVLADIHDLLVAPKLGTSRNDVGQALKRAVGSLESKNGAELWVIAAADSGQPSHVSYLEKKTLLQSAVEYSLRENQPHKSEPLKLTDFFQKVFDYSQAASENYQTPLLLFNGESQPVSKETASGLWEAAGNVCVVQTTDQIPAVNESDNSGDSAEEANNKDAKAEAKSQAAQKGPETVADGQTNGDDPSAPVEESDRVKQETVEKDVRFRFWQLRDQILSDGISDPKRPPIPSSFAADRWQFLAQEAAAYERLCWALDSESQKRKEHEKAIESLVDELEGFHSLNSATNQPVTTAAADTLSKRWSEIREALNDPFSERRVWLDHGLLASDLQEPWKVARERLLKLTDAACQLPDWFELSLHPDLQGDLPKLYSGSQPLFEEVRENIRIWAEKDSMLSSSSAGQATLDQGNLQALQQELESCLEQLCDKINDSTKKLNWRDERKIQVLLTSGLLDWKTRKNLSDYLQLSEKRLEKVIPRPSSVPTTQDQSSSLTNYSFFYDFVRELEQQSEQLLSDERLWQPWLLSCVDQLRPRQTTDPQSGAKQPDLLLPGSDDRKLHVHSGPTGERLSRPLEFEIRRRNGTSLKECWVGWRTDPSEGVAALKIVKDQGGVVVPQNQFVKQLTSMSDQILFSSTPLSESESLRVDTKLVFAFSETQPNRRVNELTGGGNDSVVIHALTLQPPPAKKFELIIERDRWDPIESRVEPGKRRVIDPDPDSDSGDQEVALEVPAVGQAKAPYQFALRNRQDRERRVQVKLYHVITPAERDWAGGNGQVLPSNRSHTKKQIDKLNPIAEIKEVLLPSASNGGPEPVPLKLVRPVSSKQDALPSKQASKSYGLVLLVEELRGPGNGGGPPPGDPPQNWVPSGERQFFWLDCKFSNPFDSEFVEVKSALNDNILEVTVSVPDSPEWWSFWGLQELKIKGSLTDERGVPLSSRADSQANSVPVPWNSSDKSLLLSPQNGTETILLRPSNFNRNNPSEKMVVHLDIGDYPRAIAIEWSKDSSNKPQSANQSFFWLDQPSISRSTLDLPSGQPPTSDKLILDDTRDKRASVPVNRWIIPNRENVSDKPEGRDLPKRLLNIPFWVDFPKNKKNVACTVEFQGKPHNYDTDRRFEPVIDLEDGRLLMSAKAMDHQWTRDIEDISGDGEFPILFTLAGQESKTLLTIVRDTRPPEDESSVEVKPRELYAEETLAIELAPKDTEDLSPIRHVYFAINLPLEEESPIYDDEDIKLEPPARRVNDGIFRLELTAADLEKTIVKSFGPPAIGDEYSVVARSVDAAGNIQDKHRSARFIWKGPKPVAKTKKEKAKPELPPPAPEVPKLFTITVVVKQEGKTPAYPENIDVNGPGDRRSPVENRIVFTDVPAGIAEYKAVYTPPIGNVFEAQKSINVTKNQTIELDTKLKK